MRMPETAVQRTGVQRTGVQRKTCACGKPMGPDGMCEECKRKQEEELQQTAVQRTAAGDVGEMAAPPIVNQVLQEPGRPLDSATRSDMESRFGQDFGQVRVHTDGAAAESAEAVSARAYTAGQNVVFNRGEFRPHSPDGRRLLAHELVHTMQQGEGLRAAPILMRDKPKEEPTVNTKKALKAQKAFWDDLHAFFPNDGRKIAGSGYDPSISHLKVSFLEGLVGKTSHSPPSMQIGKDYVGEKDADKRKAWIKAELEKINKWRVESGRIDDLDAGDPDVTKWIDKLDLAGKLDVIQKMKARETLVANAKMQEFVRNRIHSTPLMAGATIKDDGSYEVQFENIKIIVMPDVYNSSEVSSGAHTSIQPVGTPNYAYPGYTWDAKNKIDSLTFTPTTPDVVWSIQTHYGPGIDPNNPSGYGVGTRATDTGEQKKLRFHEGSHGEVFIREIKNKVAGSKYPEWKGALGQSKKTFETHLANFRAGVTAFKDMQQKAVEASTQEVDCVGKTIVQYHQEQGTTTTVVCKP
jgi:hypothetical protein